MTPSRGPYRSREETRRRLLEAGAELAADRPACDAFAHVNVAEVTTEAETSATSLHRLFGTVDGFRQALLDQIVAESMAAIVAELDEDVGSQLEEHTPLAEVCRQSADSSFREVLADDTDQYQVAMAAMASDERAAEAYGLTDQASTDVMASFYKSAGAGLGFEPKPGVTWDDLAELLFAFADGQAIWHRTSDRFDDSTVDGPDDIDVRGPWTRMGLATWSIIHHVTDTTSAGSSVG